MNFPPSGTRFGVDAGAPTGSPAVSLRSPLTEPPCVIDVAYWPFASFRSLAAFFGAKLTLSRIYEYILIEVHLGPDGQIVIERKAPVPSRTSGSHIAGTP